MRSLCVLLLLASTAMADCASDQSEVPLCDPVARPLVAVWTDIDGEPARANVRVEAIVEPVPGQEVLLVGLLPDRVRFEPDDQGIPLSGQPLLAMALDADSGRWTTTLDLHYLRGIVLQEADDDEPGLDDGVARILLDLRAMDECETGADGLRLTVDVCMPAPDEDSVEWELYDEACKGDEDDPAVDDDDSAE
jgi:hypothetical protein